MVFLIFGLFAIPVTSQQMERFNVREIRGELSILTKRVSARLNKLRKLFRSIFVPLNTTGERIEGFLGTVKTRE